MADEVGGEKLIRNLAGTFDVMISNISNQALNLDKFIQPEIVKMVCLMSKNVSPDMLRHFLEFFSNRAMLQYKDQTSEKTKGEGEALILIGYRILISNIVQRTYRTCILDKVNMNSKVAIFEHVRNIYRSSRIGDPDILVIKNSIEQLVLDSKLTSRESTQASLKIALILYILFLSFNYLSTQ